MQTVTDHTQQVKDFSAADTKAALISSNGKWFVVVLFLLLTVLILLFMLNGANNRAEKAPEVRWVMLYPNGEWRIQFTPPSSPQEFYKTTIDKLLTDYLEYRFQLIPQTIRDDFGRATLFQSPTVRQYFVSPDGFDAVGKAGELTASRSSNTTQIKVLFFDHQDKVSDAVFKSGKKPVIRTTAYIDEQEHDAFGTPKGSPIRKIINLSWTLQTPSELKNKERKFFSVNPLGLEILSERVTIDSVYNNEQR